MTKPMTPPWHAPRDGVAVHTSAASFLPEDWDPICGSQPFAEHRWLCLLEAIRLNYRPIYLAKRSGSDIVAGAVCWPQSDFHVTKNISSSAARAAIDTIARRRPILTCSLAGFMQSGLLVPDRVGAASDVAELIDSMRGVARSEGALCVAFNDLGARDAERLAGADVSFTRDLPPEAVVAIEWPDFDSYLAGLPGKKRVKVRRYRRRAAESGVTVSHGTLAEVATTDFEQLVRQVEHRHGNDYPYVAGFINVAAQHLDDTEQRAICATLDGRLVACAAVLRSGSAAIVKWTGLDYSRSRETYAYHLLMTECVRAAIELGASELFLGPTTYPIKRQVGAQLIERQVAVTGRRAMSSILLNQIQIGADA